MKVLDYFWASSIYWAVPIFIRFCHPRSSLLGSLPRPMRSICGSRCCDLIPQYYAYSSSSLSLIQRDHSPDARVLGEYSSHLLVNQRTSTPINSWSNCLLPLCHSSEHLFACFSTVHRNVVGLHICRGCLFLYLLLVVVGVRREERVRRFGEVEHVGGVGIIVTEERCNRLMLRIGQIGLAIFLYH